MYLQSLAWELRCCQNRDCPQQWWHVGLKRSPQGEWWVSADASVPGFLVTASEPLCPTCGEPLLTRLELEGGCDAVPGDDANPLVAFVRGLTQRMRPNHV